jgi:hypothetical protein
MPVLVSFVTGAALATGVTVALVSEEASPGGNPDREVLVPAPGRVNPQGAEDTVMIEGEVGETLTTPLGNEVTVHSFAEARELIEDIAGPEETFYEADVEFCSTGEQGDAPSGSDIAYFFRVETADNRSFESDGTHYRSDYLVGQTRPLQPNECIRGPIGFPGLRASEPTALVQEVTGALLRWQV